MKPYEKVYDVECEICGDHIPFAVVRKNGHVYCHNCYDPDPSNLGCIDHHVKDDISGYLGSWDNAVNAVENSR